MAPDGPVPDVRETTRYLPLLVVCPPVVSVAVTWKLCAPILLVSSGLPLATLPAQEAIVSPGAGWHEYDALTRAPSVYVALSAGTSMAIADTPANT